MHYFGKIFKEKLGVEVRLTGESVESRQPSVHDRGALRRITDCTFSKNDKHVSLCYYDRDTVKSNPNKLNEKGIYRAFYVIDSNTKDDLSTMLIPIDDIPTGFREALVVALNRIIEDLFYQCHQSFDFEKNGKNFFEEMFLHKFPLDTDGDNNDPLEKELTQVTPKDIDDEEGDA